MSALSLPYHGAGLRSVGSSNTSTQSSESNGKSSAAAAANRSSTRIQKTGECRPTFVGQYSSYKTTKLKLGKGSFGSVVIAYDADGTICAAKKINEDHSLYKSDIEAVQREMSIQRQLATGDCGEHFVHILDEIDTVDKRGKPQKILILPLADRGTLASRIHGRMASAKHTPALIYEEVRHSLRLVLEGLVELEREGVVHRDIKSQNILMKKSENGVVEPKIADFGLSRMIADERRYPPGGTAAYKAPESLDGIEDTKGDVWAFTTMLYNLMGVVAGLGNEQLPFFNGRDEFYRVLRDPGRLTVPVSVAFEDPQLLDVLSKGLEVDPEQRASAKDLLAMPFFQGTFERMHVVREMEDSLKDFELKWRQVSLEVAPNDEIMLKAYKMLSVLTQLRAQGDNVTEVTQKLKIKASTALRRFTRFARKFDKSDFSLLAQRILRVLSMDRHINKLWDDYDWHADRRDHKEVQLRKGFPRLSAKIDAYQALIEDYRFRRTGLLGHAGADLRGVAESVQRCRTEQFRLIEKLDRNRGQLEGDIAYHVGETRRILRRIDLKTGNLTHALGVLDIETSIELDVIDAARDANPALPPSPPLDPARLNEAGLRVSE